MNQFSIGGGPVNTVVGNSYNPSSGYPVSTSQNSGGTSTQVSRENHSTHFRRARAVTSESLRSQRPSSNSRYSRPFLTRGWRNRQEWKVKNSYSETSINFKCGGCPK